MNQIKIDLERPTGDIDPNIFGGYMEIGLWGDTRYDYLDIGDLAPIVEWFIDHAGLQAVGR